MNPAKNHQRVDKKFKGDLALCSLCRVVQLMKMVNRTMYPKFEQLEPRDRAKTTLDNNYFQIPVDQGYVVRPSQSMMTKNITLERDQVLCFQLWLIDPIWARKALPHSGHWYSCKFLEQVSRRSLWICAAHASSEPMLSCFARRGQRLC